MRARIKPKDIDVPEDNPFQYDALDRKGTVEILARLIVSIEGPGVVGIDADWGNGKTTFLRMLHQFLAKRRVPVVSFNAWESDYVSDPFTAIVTELTDALEEYANEPGAEIATTIKTGLVHAKAVIKARAPTMLRSLVAEVPVAGKALEEVVAGFADSQEDDRITAYREARKSVEEFSTVLEDIARLVPTGIEHGPLVVMIDELDRCRPSYAVELLEVAKHLFAVDGVVFVIAVNRSELAHSVQALYGQGFDAKGYLGRFFDVDFRLPDSDRSRFIKDVIDAVGIRAYLGRTADQSGSNELLTLMSMLEAFFGEPVISLRTAARAIHHLGVVYAALADGKLVLGTTTAILARILHERS
ncbi:MAG: P-loop NTPase fold protein [Gammaproteobacteria bacterium]|nr:P-loop NTPase fold protein [Gammaproteobacteria bacterium]MDE0274069.1 P-loop NTPase fold protein [Gammaproteobacteria bacterium]